MGCGGLGRAPAAAMVSGVTGAVLSLAMKLTCAAGADGEASVMITARLPAHALSQQTLAERA